MTKDEYLQDLSDCVREMREEQVTATAEAYLSAGYPALDGIVHGLVDGMQRATALFEEERYYIPEILLCADTMNAGLAILQPHVDHADQAAKRRIVLGVVRGDTHDIGKNLVRIMLETAGYDVFDLGRDVPLERFVEKTQEIKADIVAISTLMSTTMPAMSRVITLLEEAGIRSRIKVIVGGAPVSEAFAVRIGADGYSANAIEAVKLADRLLKNRTAGTT